MGGQTDRLADRQAGRKLVGRRMSIVEASLDMMLGDSSAEDTSLTSAMYANGFVGRQGANRILSVRLGCFPMPLKRG
jgi:hypothetical protein